MLSSSLRNLTRMASTEKIALLKTQAEQADRILADLRNQIKTLKEAAVSSAGKDEAAKFRNENACLKLEIGEAKMQLIALEIHNGVKQVLIPSTKVTAAASAEKVETVAKPTAPIPAKADGDKKKEKTPSEKKPDGKNKKAASKPAPEEERMDISRLDLRIGKIIACDKHPDADTLYVETVDVGEEKTRTIVSGLVKHVPLEQMQNRLAVFMCNLKPAKMRGVMSEGMIMCASNPPEKVEILIPPSGVIPGDKISFDGFSGEPDAQLPPKKKIWETLKPFVKTDAKKVATYKGVPFKVEGKGIVVAETLADTQIS